MMNYDMHHWVPPMYNKMQQFAEIHPDDPKMYRTFFLQRDNVANMIRMRAVSNWVHGEVPPTIRVAHPMHLAKIKSGALF